MGIIIKWILTRYAVRVWTRFSWLRIRSSGGPFVKTVLILQVPYCQLLTEISTD
jgi:hypothetical protein